MMTKKTPSVSTLSVWLCRRPSPIPTTFFALPLLDETIDFAAPPMKIIDLDESRCILDFRFRKLELLEIADLLWPKMELFLEGTCDKILIQNRTRATMKLVCCLSFFAYHAHVAFIQIWRPTSICKSRVSLQPSLPLSTHCTLWRYPTFQIHPSFRIVLSSTPD